MTVDMQRDVVDSDEIQKAIFAKVSTPIVAEEAKSAN